MELVRTLLSFVFGIGLIGLATVGWYQFNFNGMVAVIIGLIGISFVGASLSSKEYSIDEE